MKRELTQDGSRMSRLYSISDVGVGEKTYLEAWERRRSNWERIAGTAVSTLNILAPSVNV